MGRISDARLNRQAEIIDAARKHFSSNTELGGILGVHRRTIELWRSGDRIMGKAPRIILRMLSDSSARDVVLKFAATEQG